MITVLDYNHYIRLVTDSAILRNLKADQLPELRLAMVVILFLVAACIGMRILLRHEEHENRQLHDVINDDHREDKDLRRAVNLAYPRIEAAYIEGDADKKDEHIQAALMALDVVIESVPEMMDRIQAEKEADLKVEHKAHRRIKC